MISEHHAHRGFHGENIFIREGSYLPNHMCQTEISSSTNNLGNREYHTASEDDRKAEQDNK